MLRFSFPVCAIRLPKSKVRRAEPACQLPARRSPRPINAKTPRGKAPSKPGPVKCRRLCFFAPLHWSEPALLRVEGDDQVVNLIGDGLHLLAQRVRHERRLLRRTWLFCILHSAFPRRPSHRPHKPRIQPRQHQHRCSGTARRWRSARNRDVIAPLPEAAGFEVIIPSVTSGACRRLTALCLQSDSEPTEPAWRPLARLRPEARSRRHCLDNRLPWFRRLALP